MTSRLHNNVKQLQTGFCVQDAFDIVVIGTGIGGLSTAALLAKAGKSVLVLERHDRPGGYAHGFKRKKYWFDSGVHITSGCGSQGYQGGQVIYKILKALGVHELIDFIPVDPFCNVQYPDLKFSLAQSFEQLLADLCAMYPDEEQGLRGLLDLSRQICLEVAVADEIIASNDVLLIREKLPALFEYRKATLNDVMDGFLSERKLKAVLAANWPYLGLPPSQVSFLYWATMFIGYLADGSYYCKGGFQNLANTLVQGIINNGGKVAYKTAVKRILVADSCVQGVLLEDGTKISAATVVSNADMRQTVYEMAGRENFPTPFLNKLENMTHSLSVFAVYIATDLDLTRTGLGHETFCYADYDHDNNYQRSKNGEITWLSLTIPTLADDSLAPPGEHIIMLTALLQNNDKQDWSRLKARYVETILQLTEDYIPGLKQHILFIESGSPSTLERYTLNYQGAAYGWDVTPDQVGPNRIGTRSPLSGLYFAGHWTAPGGGVYGVSVSAVLAAQSILEIPSQKAFWGYLGQEQGVCTNN